MTEFPYKIAEDGISLSLDKKEKNKRFQNILRQDHNSDVKSVSPATLFNRGIRFGKTLLVTGDEPCAALLTTNPEPRVDPHFHKLGELCVGIMDDEGNFFPASQAENIKAVFLPHGTEWQINFEKFPSLFLKFIVTFYKDAGIAARLSSKGGEKYPGFKTVFSFGGYQFGDRTYQPEYIIKDKNCIPSEVSFAGNGLFKFKPIKGFDYKLQPSIEECVLARFYGCCSFSVLKDRAQAIYSLGCKENLYFAAVFGNEDNLSAELLPACGNEFDNIINYNPFAEFCENIRLQTPDPYINAAFGQALLHLNYLSVGKAFYEGGHWWNCYWTNNYQISAAVSLGDYKKAREALLFFGGIEDGYTTTNADGTLAWKVNVPDYKGRIYGYDGLPYYICQLHQYTLQTGDTSVFEKVFINIFNMIETIEGIREHNGLYGWQMGSNSFLYQADHLGMPGESSSVSLMMGHVYKLLSELSALCGKNAQSNEYLTKSKKIYQLTISRLWDEGKGLFINHKDLQGKAHYGYYYTDFVFPSLYASLPFGFAESCLYALKKELCFRSAYHGGLLMRVGILKPKIFGNDNAMPTQMAEAARALLKKGDADTAAELLQSVGISATVFTEAPGSFPERLNDDGKGEYNYLFGNPSGSYAYACVDGLFGLCEQAGGIIKASPAFPSKWEFASCELPFAKIDFKAEHSKLIYKLTLKKRYVRLDFCAALKPLENAKVTVNGKKWDFVLRPACNTTFLYMEIPIGDGTGDITINIEPVFEKICLPAEAVEIKGYLRRSDYYHNAIFSQAFITGEAECSRPIYVPLKNAYNETVVELKEPIIIKKVFLNAGQSGLYLKIYAEVNAPCSHMAAFIYGMDIPLEFSEKIYRDGQCLFEFPIGNDIGEGIYKVEVIFYDNAAALNKFTGHIVFPDECKLKNCLPLDLRDLLNDEVFRVCSAWRQSHNYDVRFLDIKNNTLNTSLADFEVIKAADNFKKDYFNNLQGKPPLGEAVKFARTVFGFSENDSRKTILLNRGITEFYIGRYIKSLMLLVISEAESRLTNSVVGDITFAYSSGEPEITDLKVCKNFSTLLRFCAPEATEVKTSDYYSKDSAYILAFGCDNSRVLERVKISISAADAEFCLIAANIII